MCLFTYNRYTCVYIIHIEREMYVCMYIYIYIYTHTYIHMSSSLQIGRGADSGVA